MNHDRSIAELRIAIEAMEADRIADLLNDLWSRLDVVIDEHGGWIDKHIGDAVMALWGAETAREDDAERPIFPDVRRQRGGVRG
ncbi:MAG: hypothetical protein ACK2T4_14300 [Candidatus Promineifilaceae bacterium]|jgi:class 3 adenylate cyclase